MAKLRFLLVSAIVSVSVEGASATFIRGEVNGDGEVNIADPIKMLGYLFSGAIIPCQDAADVNDDGQVNIADPIYALGYLFAHGDPPKLPFPEAGTDPTTDDLTCNGGGTDTDGDGLSDEAEVADYGTDPEKADTDGDGIGDGKEIFTTATSAVQDDTDGDGLKDGAEDRDADGVLDAGETDARDPDTDDDGLNDGAEAAAGTNPRDADSDDDGLADGLEATIGTNPRDPDTDGDGLEDGEEMASGGDGFVTNPLAADSDGDGLEDGDELTNHASPLKSDSDGDGLSDGVEVNQYRSNPIAVDTDDDELSDRDEATLGTDLTEKDTDGDGIPDPWEREHGLDPKDRNDGAADADGDGLSNLKEFQKGTDPQARDTDADGSTDGQEVTTTGTDPLDRDSDDDGRTDGEEVAAGTNPKNKHSDADGISDGIESRWNEDVDGDGLVCAADRDSDGDGVDDEDEDTNKNGIVDTGETDPCFADSDKDGMPDGFEIDHGFKPLDPADGALDADADGLSNAAEARHGTDPEDADSDDDTLKDGVEVAAGLDPKDPTDAAGDVDGDGLTNVQEIALGTKVADADSDDDGLTDGQEQTTYGTNPLVADTDGDAVSDGTEVSTYGSNPKGTDSDGDGIADGVEVGRGMSPTKTDSDGDGIADGEEIVAGADGYVTDPTKADTDGDGLSDKVEIATHGTDPTAADSDDDGMDDGAEISSSCDPKDPDSDDDGLFDGAEIAAGSDPLLADTDDDGLLDGEDPDPVDEDVDDDGLIDGREAPPSSIWFEAEDSAALVVADDQARNGSAGTHQPGTFAILSPRFDVEPGDYRFLARARSTPLLVVNPAHGVLGGAISAMDFNESGTGLIAADTGGILKVEGETVTDLSSRFPGGPHAWSGVSWKPAGGTYALVASSAGRLFRLNDDNTVSTIGSGLGPFSAVRWSPLGTEAIATTEAGQVYRYREGVGLELLPGPARPPLTGVAWKPAGTEAILVGFERTVLKYVTGMTTLEPVTGVPSSIPPMTAFMAVAAESGGRMVIAGTERTILVHDSASGAFRDFTLRDPELTAQPAFFAAASGAQGTVLCGEKALVILCGNQLSSVTPEGFDYTGTSLTAAATTVGGQMVFGGMAGAVVTLKPAPSVTFSVFDGATKVVDHDRHPVAGPWGSLYRWYQTPAFTIAGTTVDVNVFNQGFADRTISVYVDRCALVPAENPLAGRTDVFDPDSDGDELSDGPESEPEAYWFEAEDWAPAAQRVSDSSASNAFTVKPAADNSFLSLTIPHEYVSVIQAGQRYQIFVRGRGGPNANHTQCRINVLVAQEGIQVTNQNVDVAVVPPSTNVAINYFVWRPTTWFFLDPTKDLTMTFSAAGANAQTVVFDKFVLARLMFEGRFTTGVGGSSVFLGAPRHLTDPLDPDSDLDGNRFFPPPPPPPASFKLGDGFLPDSAGPLTDGRETALGMNPLDMDTDGDYLVDSVDPNPLSADSDGDGLLDGIEDIDKNGNYTPGVDYTNLLDPDSDGDGILDGNEDADMNGAYDPDQGETNATCNDADIDGVPDGWDTDGDTLPDGLEKGLAKVQGPSLFYPGIFVADTDPKTITDPRKKDSDGDTIDDNVEDSNGNGAADAGETDASRGDTDGDGLSDGAEDANKNHIVDAGETNPLKFDTDNDGLGDGAEKTTYGTRPTAADSDGDGLSDGEEVVPGADGYITNPNDADTDDDLLPDGKERGYSNPTVVDTDGDGLTDGQEDANKNGVVDPGESNPKLSDSDGDGLNDGAEVNVYGTKAADPDTDSDGFSDGEEVAQSTNPKVVDAPPKVVNRAGVGYEADSWSNSNGVLSSSGDVTLTGPGGSKATIDGSVSLNLKTKKLNGEGSVRMKLLGGTEVEIFDGSFSIADFADPMLTGAAPGTIELTADAEILDSLSVSLSLEDGTFCGHGRVFLGLSGAGVELEGDFCVNPSSGILTMENDVEVKTPVGSITLFETALTVNLSRLYCSGYSRLPFPDIPFLTLTGELPGAAFVLDPLAGRFYFHLNAGFHLEWGPFSIDYGPRGTFEIDIPRGYFLIEAEFEVSEVGIKVLYEIDKSGNILFEPAYLIDGFLEEDIRCHLRSGGGVGFPIPVPLLSVSIEGEQGIRFGADDLTYAVNGSVGIGIAVVGIELGGGTAVLIIEDGEIKKVVAGSSSGMVLKDLATGIGDFGKFGQKTEVSLEIIPSESRFHGEGIYTYNGFEIDLEFEGDKDGLCGSGSLDPPFGFGPSVDVEGEVKANGDIRFAGSASFDLGPVTLGSAEFELTNDGMSVGAEASIPGFGAMHVDGEITNQTGGGIYYELEGTGTLSPLGFDLADASFKLTPSEARVSGKLTLPGGLGKATVSGTVTRASFELTGAVTLDLGGFSANGTVTIKPTGIWFSGDVTATGLGSIKLAGELANTGSFSLTGSGDLSIHALSASGSFTLSGTRTSAQLSGSGSFKFANLTGASASFTIQSSGTVSGSCTIKACGGSFSASFSVSTSGRASVSASSSVSVTGALGVKVTGSVSLSADTSGNIKASFEGSAKYLDASISVGGSVDVKDGKISFSILGQKFTVDLF